MSPPSPSFDPWVKVGQWFRRARQDNSGEERKKERKKDGKAGLWCRPRALALSLPLSPAQGLRGPCPESWLNQCSPSSFILLSHFLFSQFTRLHSLSVFCAECLCLVTSFFFFVLSALSACVSVQSVPFPLCLSACVPCCCLLCCFCFVDSLLFDCQCYPFFSQSPLLL